MMAWGLHFIDGTLHKAISSRPNARAYRVERTSDGVTETVLPTTYLGSPYQDTAHWRFPRLPQVETRPIAIACIISVPVVARCPFAREPTSVPMASLWCRSCLHC